MRCPYCSTSFLAPQELIAARSSMTAGAAPQPGSAAAGNSAAPAPEADEAEEGEFFEDDFSDPESGWDVGQRSGGVKLSYEYGSYRIFLAEDESSWESYVDEIYSDFVVEVDVSRYKGPKDGEFGVTCRADDDGCYRFWLTGEGRYGICKVYFEDDEEEEYVDLAEGKAGIMQLSGAFNRLRASCVGPLLTMHLNGKKVLEARDNEFAQGDIALMASTGESDKGGLDVRFKNLVVRAP
jgi:hypothetical protein